MKKVTFCLLVLLLSVLAFADNRTMFFAYNAYNGSLLPLPTWSVEFNYHSGMAVIENFDELDEDKFPEQSFLSFKRSLDPMMLACDTVHFKAGVFSVTDTVLILEKPSYTINFNNNSICQNEGIEDYLPAIARIAKSALWDGTPYIPVFAGTDKIIPDCNNPEYEFDLNLYALNRERPFFIGEIACVRSDSINSSTQYQTYLTDYKDLYIRHNTDGSTERLYLYKEKATGRGKHRPAGDGGARGAVNSDKSPNIHYKSRYRLDYDADGNHYIVYGRLTQNDGSDTLSLVPEIAVYKDGDSIVSRPVAELTAEKNLPGCKSMILTYGRNRELNTISEDLQSRDVAVPLKKYDFYYIGSPILSILNERTFPFLHR